MNDKEQLEFCGSICMAARKLGIKLIELQTPTSPPQPYFQWHDPVGARITGPAKPTRKEALYLACDELMQYFNRREPAKA